MTGMRHEPAVQRFENDPVHRCLHLAVARLFADQLRRDLELLRPEDIKAKRNISLCGKWAAPCTDCFHDRHTFIVTTIAELLHPNDDLTVVDVGIHEVAIRHAREEYRRSVSALRAHLQIVERELTAKTLANIRYEQVPSSP